MQDIMANLKTFQPEYEAGIYEPLLYLKCRAKGRTVTACAHALFCYRVLQATRPKEKREDASPSFQASKGSQIFKIGIIGGGHIGKQLGWTLLQLGGISEQNIQISTRQPEKLSEFQLLGVNCFYNNRQLVEWADIVFLCCLPSHLPCICSEVQDALKRWSVVYSLVTGVPLPRLRQLLSCNSIMKPQYTFIEDASFHIWTASRTVVEALRDPAVIQATCPCSPVGGVAVNTNWLAAVLYAALNSYTGQGFRYTKALALLNQVWALPDDNPATPGGDKPALLLECEHFINEVFASSLSCDDPLPWFDLTTVQQKNSPLNQFLTTDASFKDNMALFYRNMLTGLPENKELTMPSKKTKLSAKLPNPIKVVKPSIPDEASISKAKEPSSIESKKK